MLKSVFPNGYTIKTLDEPTQEQLIKEILDAEYLLGSGRLKINIDALNCAKNLKMIQCTGVVTEMLDIEKIKSRNIPICVNVGVNARSVT